MNVPARRIAVCLAVSVDNVILMNSCWYRDVENSGLSGRFCGQCYIKLMNSCWYRDVDESHGYLSAIFASSSAGFLLLSHSLHV